jgi:hypothetical protein
MLSVDEIIAWDVPKPVRRLSREEIIAAYGEKSVRPLKSNPKTKEPILPYVVNRRFDSGQEEIVSDHATFEQANKEAGRKRDTMTDDECGGDFTYLPGKRKAETK